MAIADMAGSGRSDDTLGRSGFGTYHQVIIAEVELLKSNRLQEEEVPVKLPCPWNSVKKRGLQSSVLENRGQGGSVCNERKKISLRENLGQSFDNSLPACAAYKPVVNDGHA
jgi:hypothetical protein